MIKENKTKKYFHELTDEEFYQAINDNKTYDDFIQPDWCNYPDALDWDGGCFVLTERIIRCKDDCKNCECYKYKKK